MARVIQVRNPNDGVVRERALRLDEFEAPFTIGTQGDLQLEDDCCCPIEAKAYFDGTTLFLASADASRLVIVNKTLVGRGWMAVPCPSVIELGSSRLVYDDARDLGLPEEHSAVRALRWEVKAPPVTTLSGKNVRHSASPTPESTSARAGFPPRGDNTEIMTLVGPMPSPTGARALRETWDSATQMFDWSEVRPGIAAAAAATAAAPAPPGRPSQDAEGGPRLPKSSVRGWLERVRQEFARTPRSIRLALYALPALALFVFDDEPAPSKRTRESHRAHPSATNSAPTPAPRAEQRDDLALLMPLTPPALALPQASAHVKAPAQRSLEARAADAAARGSLAEAMALYDELVKARPDRSDFRAVQRILAARAEETPERRRD